MRAAFIDTMAYLCRRLGLKTRLRDVGCPDSTIDKLVRDAMLPQRLLVNNPRARDETDSHLMLRASEWLNRAVGAEGKRH